MWQDNSPGVPVRPLLIWGASGHARVVTDIVHRVGEYRIVGYIDTVQPERAGDRFGDAVILGGWDALREQFALGVQTILIAIGDCAARMRCASAAQEMGFTLATAIHPSATLAGDVAIGAGTVIAAGAIVNPAAAIGENVIVNTAASIDHDCRVADGVHISPGVRLGGGVRIGRGTWVGIGAVVSNHLTIGADTIIGAGAVVVNDIPPGVIAYGVPAHIKRQIQ